MKIPNIWPNDKVLFLTLHFLTTNKMLSGRTWHTLQTKIRFLIGELFRECLGHIWLTFFIWNWNRRDITVPQVVASFMGFSPILKTKVTIQVFPKENRMTVTYQIVSHQDVVRMVTNEEFRENRGTTTRIRKGTCSLLDRAFTKLSLTI